MTTSSLTLDQLSDLLRKPLPPELIKFLPKTPQQREGKWFCLALPYAVQSSDLIWKRLVKQEMSGTLPRSSPSTRTGQAQTSEKAAAQ